jgi:hypothetical protein
MGSKAGMLEERNSIPVDLGGRGGLEKFHLMVLDETQYFRSNGDRKKLPTGLITTTKYAVLCQVVVVVSNLTLMLEL